LTQQQLADFGNFQTGYQGWCKGRVSQRLFNPLTGLPGAVNGLQGVVAWKLRCHMSKPAGNGAMHKGDVQCCADFSQFQSDLDRIECIDRYLTTAKQFTPVFRRKCRLYRHQGYGGIDFTDSPGSRCYLDRIQIRRTAEQLPVQIMLLENIKIDNHNLANAKTGQFFHNIAAQASATDHGHAAAKKGQLITDGYNIAIALIAGRQNASFQDSLFNLGYGQAETFGRLYLVPPG